MAVAARPPVYYLSGEDMYAEPGHKERAAAWALRVNPKPSKEERERIIAEKLAKQRDIVR